MADLPINIENVGILKKTKQALDITRKVTTNQVQITQEHIDWWENLPQIWKRIFLIHLYVNNITKLPYALYSEILGKLISHPEEKYYTDVVSGNIEKYYLDELLSYNDLAKLFSLESIVCYFSENSEFPISGDLEEIPYLGYFSNLKKLILANYQIEDISNAGLEKLYNLEILIVRTTGHGLKRFPNISALNNLRVLVISLDNEIADKNINNIAKLQNLTMLSIHFDKEIDSRSLIENISKLNNLKMLNINIKLWEIDIFQLAKLENLEYLYVYQLPHSNFKLPMNLRKLKNLYARNMNKEQKEWLASELPNCKFSFI